jgi:hypothetical protein
MTDDGLTPDKLAQAIARLEAEKARRTGGKPADVINKGARSIVGPETNTIISNPPAHDHLKPTRAPGEAAQGQEAPAARLPVPFYIVTSKPVAGVADDAGSVEEAWYVVKGKELALSDAAGDPIGDWRPIEERGTLFTARQALRQRLAAKRGPGPNHRPIQYRDVGWR